MSKKIINTILTNDNLNENIILFPERPSCYRIKNGIIDISCNFSILNPKPICIEIPTTVKSISDNTNFAEACIDIIYEDKGEISSELIERLKNFKYYFFPNIKRFKYFKSDEEYKHFMRRY